MQAEFDQFAHRMRQHVDADAERFQRRHALEYFGGNADLVQAERQRQPADAAAGDENGHELFLRILPVDAVIPGRARLRARTRNPDVSHTLDSGSARGAHPGMTEEATHAALVLRWRNMMARASSSISALKTNLSFSAIARAAAGRAETSSSSRFTLGYFASASSPRTNGIMRAQPQNAMSTMV